MRKLGGVVFQDAFDLSEWGAEPEVFPDPGRRRRRGQRQGPASLSGPPATRKHLGARAMDRFCWTNGLLEIHENLVTQQRGVRLYDGEEKVRTAAADGSGLRRRVRGGGSQGGRARPGTEPALPVLGLISRQATPLVGP